MITLQLNAQEARILADMLHDELENTTVELRRTENVEYKDHIQARFNLLQRLIRELAPAVHAGT